VILSGSGFKDIKLEIHCVMKTPIILESMKFPHRYCIEPKTKADVDKMGMAF
jgi:translation elongation factor EF-G